ncbi:MAG TPA: NAD-dependent deacylase [Syntrophales bacterium]|nr:NAD-dependent deacylase [Syntrophales bacterium]HPN25790.1 NAD-dependent deacylase [Syntrophales bacterium]HQM30565.1 NAD-dependent deacylase [Syntrophales bacterium]
MLVKSLYDQISIVADMIIESKRVVVFTGAGVSTESGIPDFRSPGGIWDRFDPDEFTIQRFLSSAETRVKQWRLLTESGLIVDAQPNPAHSAIADIERMGKLSCVITQNIDNLHHKAGNSPEKIFELHGNMNWIICLNCQHRYPLPDIRKRLDLGSGPPFCEKCSGILKPDVVFFGESLPPLVLDDAVRHSRECDLLIVVGSSLVVYPAAYIPVYAKEAGARVVIVNLTATEYDKMADEVINSKAGEVMPRIMEAVQERIS